MARQAKPKERQRFTIQEAEGRTFLIFQPDVNNLPLFAGAVACRRAVDDAPLEGAPRELLTGRVFHLLQEPTSFEIKWPAAKPITKADALNIWRKKL